MPFLPFAFVWPLVLVDVDVLVLALVLNIRTHGGHDADDLLLLAVVDVLRRSPLPTIVLPETGLPLLRPGLDTTRVSRGRPRIRRSPSSGRGRD